MGRRSGGLLIAVLFLALWSGGSGSHLQVPAEKATSTAAASSGKTGASDGANAAPHREEDESLTGMDAQTEKLTDAIHEATASSLTEKQLEQLRNALGQTRGDAGVGFMIAIAPDPVKTHLALGFDRYVDAIQQAFQSGGFDFDRALLPWDSQIHDEPASPITRESEQKFQQAEEQLPGVLIFRRHHETKPPDIPKCAPEQDWPVETLLVFVVGELPTAGVERTQFMTALELGKTMTDSTSGSSQRLLILGPNFSGSLYSLQQLLVPAASDFSQVTIVSGEVTGAKSVAEFESSLSNAGLRKKVNFASFNESSSVLEDALFRYGRTVWHLKPSEFAILSETETAFGREGTESSDQGQEEDGADDQDAPLQLRFPRGIYHLRTAYGRQFPDGLPQKENRPQLRSNLKPNLEEQRTAVDSIPDFSIQSPVSEDGILMGLIDDLQRHRSQVLVVLASDPLDSLFLVRYIRQHYAYGRVVILGPDALLRHESDDPQIRGVLSIAAYSLVHATGIHPGQGHSTAEISFPDDSSQASYNAGRVLTACLQGDIPWCRRPLDAAPDDFRLPSDLNLLGYHNESFVRNDPSEECCRPSIYLDALGREGYWPIAELSARNSWLPVQAPKTHSRGHASPDSSSSPTFDLPMAWSMLAVLGIGAMSFLAFCFYNPSILSAYEPGVLLAPAPIHSPNDTAAGRRISLIGWFCTVVCTAIAFVMWPMFAHDADWAKPIPLIATTFGLAYLALSFVLWRQYRTRILGFHAATATMLCGVWIFRDTVRFQVFLFHSAQVGSELSPLLPFVLVVLSVLWWTWYNISGSVLTDLRRPQLPSLTQGLPNMLLPISGEDHNNLEVAKVPLSMDRRIYISVAAVLVGVFLLTFPVRPIRSLESTNYDDVLIFAVVFSFALLLESTLRAIVVWIDLKRLLRALESQPFRNMMGRVGGFSWSFIWNIGSACLGTAHSLLSRQIEALRKARALDGGFTDELFPDRLLGRVWTIYFALRKQRGRVADPALAALTTLSSTETQHETLDAEISETGLLLAFRDLQQSLAGAGAKLLAALSRYYQTHPEIACEINSEEIKKLQSCPPQSSREVYEYYVCIVYINYIISTILRIRTLVVAAVGVYVLDVLALNCYPFEPRAVLGSLTIGVLAVLAVCFGIIYAQMHYDPTLSRITETTPGELGRDFWWRMLSVLGVPLASLLASEFPAVGDFVFSWIEPITKALR